LSQYLRARAAVASWDYITDGSLSHHLFGCGESRRLGIGFREGFYSLRRSRSGNRCFFYPLWIAALLLRGCGALAVEPAANDRRAAGNPQTQRINQGSRRATW
jgi:hypothetical protein